MAGYLDKVRELKKSWHDSGIGPGRYYRSPESGGQSPSNDAPKGFQVSLDCEISELSEKRSALLDQLRKGQSWLLDQHERLLSDDTTAANDAEFSRVWNGWWELDHRLRVDHGFQGCIYGPDGACPDGFPCQGCADLAVPGVVAQLELMPHA